MKLTDNVKKIMIHRLSTSLEDRVTLVEFNEVFMYLDRWNTAYKTVPYGIFTEDLTTTTPFTYDPLNDTKEGRIFKKWLEDKTSNIEKDFNKSRKVVRLLKTIVMTNQHTLAFNLSANNIFSVAIASFYVDKYQENTPFSFPIHNQERFNTVLQELKGYLALIFFINTVKDTLVTEKILDLFINGQEEQLFENLLNLGTIYW